MRLEPPPIQVGNVLKLLAIPEHAYILVNLEWSMRYEEKWNSVLEHMVKEHSFE